MRRLFLIFLLLSGLAAGEQVFIRNKPYKGPITGKGAQTSVDLKLLAVALDAKVAESNGGWVVSRSAPSGEAAPGKALVEGKELPVEVQGDAVMVNLKQAAEALGARVAINSGLGSIDVNLAVSAISAAPAATPGEKREAPLQPLPVQHAQQKQPGDAIDLKKELRAGRITVLDFYADW